jgi:hypothetical protein
MEQSQNDPAALETRSRVPEVVPPAAQDDHAPAGLAGGNGQGLAPRDRDPPAERDVGAADPVRRLAIRQRPIRTPTAISIAKITRTITRISSVAMTLLLIGYLNELVL